MKLVPDSGHDPLLYDTAPYLPSTSTSAIHRWEEGLSPCAYLLQPRAGCAATRHKLGRLLFDAVLLSVLAHLTCLHLLRDVRSSQRW